MLLRTTTAAACVLVALALAQQYRQAYALGSAFDDERACLKVSRENTKAWNVLQENSTDCIV